MTSQFLSPFLASRLKLFKHVSRRVRFKGSEAWHYPGALCRAPGQEPPNPMDSVAYASGDWLLLRDGRVGVVSYSLRAQDSPVRFAVSFPGIPIVFNGSEKEAAASSLPSSSGPLLVGEEDVLKALEVTFQTVMGGLSSTATVAGLSPECAYSIQLFACALDGVQSDSDVKSVVTPKASTQFGSFGKRGFKAAYGDKVTICSV